MKTLKTVASNANDQHAGDRKGTYADTFACPYCNKNVKLVSYGDGWIGTCCNRVVYSSQTLPEQ